MAVDLPDIVYVCPVCWAGARAPSVCEHAGARAAWKVRAEPVERDGPFVRSIDGDEWVGLTEVVRELGRTRQTIVDWIKKGFFPSARRSSPAPRAAWRVKRSDVEAIKKGRPPT